MENQFWECGYNGVLGDFSKKKMVILYFIPMKSVANPDILFLTFQKYSYIFITYLGSVTILYGFNHLHGQNTWLNDFILRLNKLYTNHYE